MRVRPGVTIVIIRDDLLERGRDELPGYLNYRIHAENDSLWNTPPTFGIYVFGLIAQLVAGGRGRARQDAPPQPGEGRAVVRGGWTRAKVSIRATPSPNPDRMMNVTFRCRMPNWRRCFWREAAKRKLEGLKGHRSVGGIRASIYNAMPREGVEQLRDFLNEFRDRHAG